MTGLITSMVSASAHRQASTITASTSSPIPFYSDGTTPMWDLVVRRDVGKQLLALEKAEKEDEMRIRRERAALTASHTTPDAAQGATGGSGQTDADDDDDEDGPKKKKKKKADGPGVTARNMSEDVRKKMSDAVAMQAAGATKYAWMTSGSGASTPAKPAAQKKLAGGAATPTTGTPGGTGGAGGGGWARAFVPTKQTGKDKEKEVKDAKVEDTRRTVTLRDAMFVVERERGHGGGRGSARGWT